MNTTVTGYRTAITRRQPSAPIQWLNGYGLINGRALDYGSGRGEDATEFYMDMYDPYWWPIQPTGKYDVITCTYVLNVTSKSTGYRILNRIRGLLKYGGKAYITVRGDVKPGMKGQRDVRLRLPLVHEAKGKYRIYLLEKNK